MNNNTWEYCNRCSGKKKHEILYHKEKKWSEDIDGRHTIYGSNIYDLLSCCGCESVKLRHKSWFSEDFDPATGQPEITIRHYPPLTFRNRPRWLSDFFPFSDFDQSISDLIHEIYVALQNNAPRLATMGIRALFETIMINKIGDHGSFKKNIKAFLEDGFISEKQKQIIETVLEAGHATIHRSYKPNKSDVVNLLDVTESILETILIDEHKAKRVADKIPPRQNEKPKD